MSSYKIRNRKFKKKIAKKFKKLKKHHYSIFSSQNKLGKAKKERKKEIRSNEFLPDP